MWQARSVILAIVIYAESKVSAHGSDRAVDSISLRRCRRPRSTNGAVLSAGSFPPRNSAPRNSTGCRARKRPGGQHSSPAVDNQIFALDEKMKGDGVSDQAEYVQPIVLLVDKANPAPAIDGIAAVAHAALRGYALDYFFDKGSGVMGNWARWLNGPFAKVVRRADPKMFERMTAEFEFDSASASQVGRAEALALVPRPSDEMPRSVTRLQVAGTNLPDIPAEFTPAEDAVHVALNASLGMTTGKAAAQAAHAYFAWWLELSDRDRTAAPAVPRVAFVDNDRILRLADEPDSVAIHDAGRTEIAPNSLTAVAYRRS